VRRVLQSVQRTEPRRRGSTFQAGCTRSQTVFRRPDMTGLQQRHKHRHDLPYYFTPSYTPLHVSSFRVGFSNTPRFSYQGAFRVATALTTLSRASSASTFARFSSDPAIGNDCHSALKVGAAASRPLLDPETTDIPSDSALRARHSQHSNDASVGQKHSGFLRRWRVRQGGRWKMATKASGTVRIRSSLISLSPLSLQH
jgi:hypothetical protein